MFAEFASSHVSPRTALVRPSPQKAVVQSLSQLAVAAQALLLALAEERGLSRQIAAMFAGEAINTTEGRAVLHVGLRGDAVRPEALAVQRQIAAFAASVRGGARRGVTGGGRRSGW